MDRCPHCAEPIEPDYSVCWRCGTHADGTPPAADFVRDDAPISHEPPARTLTCLRCEQSMTLVRRMKFHEGSRAWPFLLGDLGELFVNRESFDTYACPDCGKVEFFLVPNAG